MVINKRLEQMHISIRTHRRNKAFQELDQQFRQSLLPSGTSNFRQSLRNSLQPPLTYRSSGLSDFSYKYSPSKKKEQIQKISKQQCSQIKNSSSLITSLNSLSQKLHDAKSFLQNSKTFNQVKNVQPIINSQNALQQVQLNNFSKKCEKNQESTINLESQKLLKGKLSCKQKIIWANSLKQYYIGPIARGIVGINDRAYQHLCQSHQFFCRHSMFPPKTYTPLNLPCDPSDKVKKVLVIDMDQTLIHCQIQNVNTSQIVVQLGDGQRGYVAIRPYALSFLKKISKNFEIIVFTASQKDYADAILNELDPHGLIKHRLYRQHCLKLNKNIYTKDLRIINRDLSQMVMVDNSAISFLCQPQNGVPILPFYGGQDRELLELQKYLQLILRQDDVRKINRGTFKLDRYKEFSQCEDLVRELYEGTNNYY